MMEPDTAIDPTEQPSPSQEATAVSQETPAVSEASATTTDAEKLSNDKVLEKPDAVTTDATEQLSSEGKIELAALKVLAHFGGADQARQHLVERAAADASFNDTVALWDAFSAGKLREYLSGKSV